MEKEYDDWNKLKKSLSTKKSNVFFHEREIWFCSLGKNIGYEEDGKNELFERPILIIRKFNNSIFLAIPLTSSKKNIGIKKENAFVKIIKKIKNILPKKTNPPGGVFSEAEAIYYRSIANMKY